MNSVPSPIDLRTECFSNPIGLGERKPVLEWRIPPAVAGLSTTAWQVQVAGSERDLEDSALLVWDSGKREESHVARTVYDGEAPASRKRYWWKVRVWDAAGQVSEWSRAAFWEMGLLEEKEWQAGWINAGLAGGPNTSTPAPFFRKSFRVEDEVVRARLYMTALGLYECELNGTRIGEAVFTPGWTHYGKRAHVQTYDITAWLRRGDNVLGCILGDGWYCGHIAWTGRQFYGELPHLCAQIELEYANGGRIVLGTDGSWRVAFGPILESDILMGETYDARRELEGWSAPGYDGTGWKTVAVSPRMEVVREASVRPMVFRQELLPATGVRSLGPAKRIYDFGQNFSGRIRLTVQGARGTCLIIRHAEILTASGDMYVENLREARATDTYILKGGGAEVWEPRFTFHGFRYAEISWKGNGVEVEKLDLTGVVLHSEMKETGSFACSNPLLNQLQHNILWGQKSNFLEAPTDCPQRNERLGWTGDAQVFVRTAAFNCDVRAFFHKWMADARDAQLPSGGIPDVIPHVTAPRDGGPAWSDAAIICPWTIYLCYGDLRILERHYDSMRLYLDSLVAESRDLIRSHPDACEWGGYGDWLALDGSQGAEGRTRKDLIGTAFLAYDAELMHRIAGLLGREAEATRFAELRERVAEAFRRRFLTPEGLLVSDTQTAYVLGLHFRLIPEPQRAVAVRELVRSIEANGVHLATGFVGTPYLCEALMREDRLDIAYRLLEQETFPSWLFPVKNGATTIWERWDGWTPEKGFQSKGMNSFNHYAYGAIGAWMYGTVAGLELDWRNPGGRKLIFQPRPGGTLTWAEAKLETPRGEAAVRWELRDDTLKVRCVVPPNAEGVLSLGSEWDAPEERLEPGTFERTYSRAVKKNSHSMEMQTGNC